jgi:carbamoyltransferase
MKQNEHEYKVMGLAPYAKDYVMSEPYRIYAETLQNDGLDFTYKIKPKDHYFYFKERLDGCRFDGIAKAIQTRIEELLLGWIKEGIKQTGIRTIVFSGGVAMNVKANKRIGEMNEVEDIFVSPSPGDESTAIGAAYMAVAEKLSDRMIPPIHHAYLGPSFSSREIMNALSEAGAFERYLIKERATIDEIAQILAKGGIVARLSGRMEFGARALGNRSILASPKGFETVRVINEMIKGRDFWMPFTPSILKERETDYIVNPKRLFASFMTIAFDSTSLARAELKGAIHPYDFTVRPQVVEKEINPAYWELIKAFEKITGIGALLNTSFNLHGQPIVNSPRDALKTFAESGLEYLLLNDILVEKKEKRKINENISHL